MYWIVVFNDGERTTVKATWIIDAIVTACVTLARPYSEVTTADCTMGANL